MPEKSLYKMSSTTVSSDSLMKSSSMGGKGFVTSDSLMKSSAGSKGSNPVAVVAIKGVAGSSKAEEWNDDMLQTGDVVEELRIGNGVTLSAPFKNGKSGLQKELHKFFRKHDTLVQVRVRRGRGLTAELQACITPDDGAAKKQQYTLRALSDPNYVVALIDSTQEDCFALQESRDSRVKSALSHAQLKDGYVAYSWEEKMHKSSGGFFSLLIIPHAPDRGVEQYNDLEDTMERAYTWLNACQASGVPILLLNIQTEPLLTKISDERAATALNAGSLSDLSSIANASLYGLEDYHGIDMGVVRAIRLWYSPVAGEIPVQLKLKEGDTRLGFAISRTDEGFFFISSVMDDPDSSSAASRAGLNDLYSRARDAGKLLVISRVSNEKIVPWMVSSAGAIRCFDSISLSQKLSLHRHALRPVLIHFMLWEEHTLLKTGQTAREPLRVPINIESIVVSSIPVMEPPSITTAADNSEGARLVSRDTAGEFSFRGLTSTSSRNWV